MKCFKHHSIDAVAVCASCGRALCPGCVPSPEAARIVCSDGCAAALLRGEETISRLANINGQLLERSRQSARASAFYCYLMGVLSAGAAVTAWFMLPSPFLIGFTGASALVLFLAGFWHGRVANKSNSAQSPQGNDLP